MSDIVIKKENEIITVEEATEENIEKLSGCSHLCWDCANACPSKCKKIANIVKKYIDEYGFIIDGYQIIDENGQVKEFIITNCNDFIREIQTKPTKEQLENYRKLREKLKAAYFEADSIDDANIIQFEMVQKHQLFNVGGTMLDEKQVMQLKQRR